MLVTLSQIISKFLFCFLMGGCFSNSSIVLFVERLGFFLNFDVLSIQLTF